jgi:hypothetical protein
MPQFANVRAGGDNPNGGKIGQPSGGATSWRGGAVADNGEHGFFSAADFDRKASENPTATTETDFCS